MKIPRRNLEKFVRDVTDQCLVSQRERMDRYAMFDNYANFGSDNSQDAAIFNKTYAYLDDLESLLYSPVSLRFHIGDPDLPNLIEEAKGKAAAAKLRSFTRKSDTDTRISEAVGESLKKGRAFIKQLFKRGEFSPTLVKPESIGVLNEQHDALDEDMEAFCHTSWITPYQFDRLISNHPDRTELLRQAKTYVKEFRGIGPADGAQKQVIVGGLYPFQPAGSLSPNTTRGIVDWMGGPSPKLSQPFQASLLQLDETWIWDDARNDWATFQMIGSKMLIMGKYHICNGFAYDTAAMRDNEILKGLHPFVSFCVNRTPGYFWGRSEIVNVALLQEALNSRINGVNRLLRKQEDPPRKFVGSTGVNQNVLAKLNKPGGYFVEQNPNAKVETEAVSIPQDLWASLHEYERMFDEMGGLPPIARGHGEAGVRSHNHAETLVRMFSPRFKDRALLAERDVEALGSLMLETCRAHVDKRMTAWIPHKVAALQAPAMMDDLELLVPPAPGLVPLPFSFADLDDDVTLSVDSHSSSPAFSAEAKALVFDLLKIGAMSPEDVVDHTDAPDPEELAAGIQRRAIAKAEAAQQELAATGKIKHQKGKH